MITTNIEKIYKGQRINNYKVLCDLVGWKVSAGDSKSYQLKDLKRYCKYKKDGNAFIIDEIFNIPKEKPPTKHKRDSNKPINRKFKVARVIEEHIGVYKIFNEETKEIYIGSTIAGFRKRYQQHYSGKDKRMEHTYKLLKKTKSKFEIIEDMNDFDELTIRRKEAEYIDQYKMDKNWIVINRKEDTYTLEKRIKYKTLKVKIPEDKYNQAMQLLIDNGFIEVLNNNKLNNNEVETNFDINNIEF